MSSSESFKEVLQSDSTHSSDEQAPQLSPITSLKEPPSPRPVRGFKWFLVCASLYIGALIYGLDTTIAADIQAAIVERFDNVERLTWVGTAFPLGSVCAILPV
jgi:hypothetical protein